MNRFVIALLAGLGATPAAALSENADAASPYGELRLFAYADIGQGQDSMLSPNPIISGKAVKNARASAEPSKYKRRVYKKRYYAVKKRHGKTYRVARTAYRVAYVPAPREKSSPSVYEAVDYTTRRAMGGMRPSSVEYMTDYARPTTRGEVAAMIKTAARREGVDEHFALALAYLENGYKPHGISSAGAMCPMQVMPNTAKLYDASMTRGKLSDPRVCIPIGMRYLKDALRSANGDKDAAAARYEAGIGSGRTDSSYARKVRQLHRHPHVIAALSGQMTGKTFNSRHSYMNEYSVEVSAYRPEGH
jgi:soluble lytic murein transglycosylase-like protein